MARRETELTFREHLGDVCWLPRLLGIVDCGRFRSASCCLGDYSWAPRFGLWSVSSTW